MSVSSIGKNMEAPPPHPEADEMGTVVHIAMRAIAYAYIIIKTYSKVQRFAKGAAP